MKRYPLGPLAALMGVSLHACAKSLGVSGSTFQKYRDEGMLERSAERLAVRAGWHPAEVWGDWLDDQIADCSRACDRCGESFVPWRRDQRFCSQPCNRAWWGAEMQRRRYRSDPVFRAREVERKRREYRASADYYRAAQRRRDRAKAAESAA